MRASALSLFVLLATSRVNAQEVRGVVVEDDTGSPIGGVMVTLFAEDSTVRGTVVTTAAGWFQLSVGSPGTYYLRASHTMYTTSADLAATVNRQETINVILRMGRATVPLEPLLVAARSYDRLAGFRERAAGRGLGRYIHRADIERRTPIRPTDLFKLESGVRLNRLNVDGVSTDVLTMNSFGEACEPTVYIDGVPLPPRIGPHDVSIDDLVSVDEIEGIEIYRSGASTPMELHVSRDSCGLIAIWTRPIRGARFSWKRLAIGTLIAVTMFVGLR